MIKNILKNNKSFYIFFFIIFLAFTFHTFTYGFIYDDRYLISTFLEAPWHLKVKAMIEYANFHFYPVYFISHLIDNFLTLKIFFTDINIYLDERRIIIPRITNAALHLINACLLFKLLDRLSDHKEKIITSIAVLFFLFHPIVSQPLFNVTSRNELLYLLFGLLTFHRALIFSQNHSWKNIIWVCGSFFLALCSKLLSIFFIILIPVYFLLDHYKNKKDKANIQNIIILFCSLIFTFIIFYTLRSFFTNSYHLKMDANIISNFFSSFYFYTKSLFFPYDHIYLVADLQNPELGFALFIGLILLFLFFIYLFIKKGKIYFLFSFLWLGASLAFPIYFGLLDADSFPLVSELAERYTYGAVPGLSFLIFGTLQLISKYHFKQKYLVTFPFIFVLIGYAFLLYDRSKVYKDDVTFFYQASYQSKPHLYYNIVPSVILMKQASLNQDKTKNQQALFYFYQNLNLFPNSVRNYLLLTQNLQEWGHNDKAMNLFKLYKKKFSNHPMILMKEGVDLLNEKKYQLALQKLIKVEDIKKKNLWKDVPQIHKYDYKMYQYMDDDVFFNIGVCYANLNLKPKALEYFKKAYTYNDLHTTAKYNAAIIAKELGDKALAEKLLFEAVSDNPKFKALMDQKLKN